MVFNAPLPGPLCQGTVLFLPESLEFRCDPFYYHSNCFALDPPQMTTWPGTTILRLRSRVPFDVTVG